MTGSRTACGSTALVSSNPGWLAWWIQPPRRVIHEGHGDDDVPTDPFTTGEVNVRFGVLVNGESDDRGWFTLTLRVRRAELAQREAESDAVVTQQAAEWHATRAHRHAADGVRG